MALVGHFRWLVVAKWIPELLVVIDLLQTIRIFIRFQWNDGVIVIHCIRLKLIDFLNSTRFWFRNVWIFTHIFFGSRQRKRPSAGGGSTFLFRYLLRLFLFFRIFFLVENIFIVSARSHRTQISRYSVPSVATSIPLDSPCFSLSRPWKKNWNWKTKQKRNGHGKKKKKQESQVVRDLVVINIRRSIKVVRFPLKMSLQRSFQKRLQLDRKIIRDHTRYGS